MREKKQVPLTETIKQFLIQSSVKAGQVPIRLPGELELCEKFKVARGTVRQAIQDAIELGYVIRLPKRRGFFSVPSVKAPERGIVIAILDGTQQSTLLFREQAMILSGFIDEMYLPPCDFSIPRMNSLTVDSIRNLNVDGLLWLIPPKESVPVIRQLSAEEFPVVAVPYLYSDHFDAESDHYVYVDYRPAAKKRAELFHKHRCKRLLVFGGSSLSIQLFEQEFKANSEAEEFIHLNYDDPGLDTLLIEKHIDSIFTFGGMCYYEKVIQSVRSLPDPSSILIQLDPGSNEEYLKKQNADLRIAIGNYARDFQKRDRDVGKNAALKLKKLLKYGQKG